MKTIFYNSSKSAVLFMIMCLFFVGNAFGQATFVSTQTGNWNSTSSWNLTSGSDSDDIPDSNDTVIILSNHTITVNTGSQACSQLTVGPTSSNISTLSFANGTTLTVGGTVSLGNSGNNNRRGVINMTNGGTLKCTGFVLNNSGSNVFTSGTGTVELTATSTLPSSIFTTFNNLIISGGTTKLGVNTTINGTLSLTTGSLDVNDFTGSAGAITGSGSLTNTSGNTRTFTIGSLNTSTTYSGVISATTASRLAITKTGTGTLTLSGANTYTGLTTVNAGTLKYGVSNALSSGGVTVNDGGTYDLNGFSDAIGALIVNSGTTGGLVSTGAGILTLGGTVTSTGGAANASITGKLALGANRNFSITNAADGLNISAIISGAFTLTKQGSGILTLSGANTYTGSTTVSAGVLNIRNATATGTTAGGVTVASGAALELQGGITVGAETLSLNNTGISNGGALRNISGNNTWGGTITLVTNAARINSDAETLTLSASNAITASNINLTLGGAGAIIVSRTITSGSGTLTKDGTGTVTLSGANTYTGVTTVSAGILKMGNNAALGTSAGATTVSSGGTLELDGFTTSDNLTLNGTGTGDIGALANNGSYVSHTTRITLGSNASIITNGSGGLFISNANAITGTLNLILGGTSTNDNGISTVLSMSTLTKNGVGNWKLSGTNTYTGLTTINAGTLKLDANNTTPLGTAAGGTVVNTGGVLDLNGKTLSVAEPLTLNGTGLTATPAGALTNTGGNASYSGNITLGSASTITATSSGTLTCSGTVGTGAFGLTLDGSAGTGTMSGIISTPTSLTKNGAGTWVLSGANTYSGGTTVSAGTLDINSTTALGATTGSFTISSGAKANVVSNVTVESLTLNGLGTSSGTWGFTGSVATNINTTYFTSTGIVTVTKDTRTIPTAGSITITTTGTWTAPVGVTSVTVEAWGGGGAGGSTNDITDTGGGGGGAYARKNSLAVTAGTSYTVTVGAGSTSTSAGGDSWFNNNTTVLAKGGSSVNSRTEAGAAGGSSISSIGDVRWDGGTGANGSQNNFGGGGGSSAGTNASGVTGSGSTGGTAPSGGGNGGNGAISAGNGNPGVVPGGGGGGVRSLGEIRTGGAGANGQVKITYNQLTYKSQIISASLGSTNWCAGETRDVTVTIKNIGTATWTDGSGGTPTINIGVKWNTNTTNWADYYVRTSANNLAPGETGTYTLTITASNNTGSGYTTALAAGTNNLIFDVVYEGISWFGNNNGGVGPGNTVFTSANQTINALPTVTSATGNSKTYTGSINTTTVSAVAIAGATIDWYDASTGGTLLASGTLTYAPTAINVGTYTVYAQARNTTTGCTSAARTSATITINKAVLTITAAAQTLSYGTAATTVTGAGSYTPTGFVNNETSSVIGGSATYTTTYTATTAAATSGVTITPIVTGLTATNYSFSAANGTITISTAALIITANNGSKTYGQTFTTGAGSANFTSSGLLNSETIGSITIASTGAISSAAVGSYEIIPSAATGGNFTASNYAISYTNGTLTVLPSAPIITITQPTCALQTGSVVLSGLPATGTWTLTRSSDSNQTTGTGTTITGLASGKYTFTVSIDDFTSEASEVEIYATTNTWNVIAGDGSWSNTLTNTQEITFDGDYNSTGDLSACSCQVTSGAVVINPGHTLKVTNAVTVSGGSLTFENNASLVQTNENPTINSGNIIYKRTTSTLSNNYDFVYWSSPVKEQKIGKIWMASNWADTFYNYDPTPNIPGWARSYATTPMIAGKGYISRARNGQSGVDYADVTSPPFIVGEKWTAKFYGVPNNGTITVTDCKAGKDCLLGNPYPSALDADAFLYENREVLEGTLYFWTHTTPMNNNAYNSNDYASYNFSGSVATAARGNLVNGDPNDNNKPTGKIAAGQSFFATAKGTANVEFKNAMRLSTVGAPLDNTQFFRTSSAKAKTANSIEKNRVWLNVSNTKGAFKQTLVGYVTDATNAYDSRFDGESFGGNTYVDFYSINQGKNFTIQGRSLPFDQNDTVPLGFKTTIEGSFTIDIDEVDGLLTNQAVYLEDKVTNTVSNLKNGNYTFTTAKGTFNDRFVLRYTDTDTTLSIDDTDQEDGILVFYSNNYKTLIIKNKVMDSTVNSVALFNMAGQNIEKWDVKDSGQTNIQIPIKNIPSGIYIVKVKTTKGESSKKIIVN